MNIFVGNLAFAATEDEVREAFTTFGSTVAVKIITDRDTGRSKGFGFVEMASADDARRAIQGLDNKMIAGRPIRVTEARPQESRGRRD